MSVATLRMKDGREVETCVVDDVASLLWAGNQGVLELHPYLARASAFDVPTGVIFDLDPGPPAGILECASLAVRLRDALDELGLTSVVKSSGGEGLHVYVPLNTPIAYPATKAFARGVAGTLVAETPEAVVDRMSKAERAGRVFVDWGQNDARKQTIAAYSLRTTVEPRVSAPLEWVEVERAVATGDASLLRHGPEAVVRRLHERGDLYAAAAELEQTLPATPYAA
jgi:bifunctional non-homologous end joining protein LigD